MKRVLAAACAAVLVPAAALQGGARAGGAPEPDTRPVLITGEVDAADSQTVFVPPSDNSPVVLRNFVAEGTQVRKGDVVLRIDTTDAADLDRLKSELERTRARAASEAANLDVAAVEAEKALVSAKAALDKARVDAAVPRDRITGLDYDRHQAELGRATHDYAVRQQAFGSARDAAARRKRDGELEVKKLQLNIAFQTAQLTQSEVRAVRDGVLVHGYSQMNGARLEEGSTAWPGYAAGTVLGDGRMAVTAWVLEADRPHLREGQAVGLRFDALPGVALTGRVAAITSAPEARPRWGLGRYFRAKIELPEHHGLALVPGMSVLVEPRAAGSLPVVPAKAPAPPRAAGALVIEGEIASRRRMAVSPPTIPGVWQYKLAQLAPEGSMVEAGQPIAVFESGEVTSQLMQQQGMLKERERALDKLALDQTEADHSGMLAVAQAQSEADKAARKAGLPKELIRRVDYDKYAIDHREKAELARLATVQYEAQRRARQAERGGLQAEVTHLRTRIASLLKGQAALSVTAPRRGLVIYRTSFNGEKFDVGSQVWMGLSVATLADPQRLGVEAKVPEAQAAGVRVGQAARVTVSGSRQVLGARVTALGRAFHAKSAAQSNVVRDVELEFESAPKDVKPGAAVQVELLPPAKST